MLPEKQRRKVNSTIKSNPPLHRNSSERAWIGAGTLPLAKALNKWHKTNERNTRTTLFEILLLKAQVLSGVKVPYS
jgi:hypothetical protein